MAVKKLLLTLLGIILLSLGAVGVLIPVLPTTPFVLLAAACFSTGCEKAAEWLRSSRVFGQYIENYRTKKGISRTLKIASIVFLWAGLATSIAITQKTWLSILLGAIGVGVTIHLLLIKTSQ